MKEDLERLNLPSASQNCFWNCPGQANLMAAAGYPESPENEYAAVGTKLHTAFETGNTLELDEEQEETYKQGLVFLDSLLAEWLAMIPNSEWTEGPREERCWIRDEEMNPIASAKLDRHYISGEYAYAIDFKSGFVPNMAPSPRSTQLRIQALCLKAEHPELKSIRVAFCKAKLRYGADDYCDFTEEDLARAEQWLMQHLWLSKQPDAPRTPGPHCGYCPAKAFCREAASYSMLPSVIAKNALPNGDFDVDLAVAQMAPVDLVRVWQSSSLIKGILTAVQSRLKAMPDDDLTALGITRGKGRENHNITNIAGALAYLRDQGMSVEQTLSCLEFSNTKLAKQLRAEKGLPSDKAATLFLKQQLAPFITVSESEKPLKELNE